MTKAKPNPRKREIALLRLWHAWLGGAFLVAYLTADEDTYAMHQFAGYAVLAAILVRVAVGLAAPSPSLLRLPRPSLGALLHRSGGRNPLFAWFAATLLAVVGLAALLGALADWFTSFEDPHEAVSEASLWVIFAHIGFVTLMYGGRGLFDRLRSWLNGSRMRNAVLAAALASALPFAAAQAADARRDALVAGYAADAKAADGAFAGFSAQRGETLFRTKWAGGDERTPSCTACHTDNPRAAGRNAKTGRDIEPLAVSANPKRFTDRDEVEKQFARDCKSVLGRACTPLEKGDYVTFMMGQ